jgi:hypothetical protein
VVILTAYFDESGTHSGSEAVAVAGYVSTPDRWERFGQEWREALAAYNIEYFHMTDFANGTNPYKQWPKQKRRHRFERLVSIINKHALASVGIVIPVSFYESAMSPKAKRISGGPYGHAVRCCFMDLAKIDRSNVVGHENVWIDYVFEAGVKGSGMIVKTFRESAKNENTRNQFRLHSIRFEDKRQFVPLQAADILAYELYKHMPRQLGIDPRKQRVEHLRHLGMIPCRWGFLGENELRRHAQMLELAPELAPPIRS